MQVKSGIIPSAPRYLIYGPEGVGKTSCSADAPSPIFLDIEGGSEALDVTRYMFGESHVPGKFTDVLSAIDDLTASQHDYKTVVIDTIDATEALIHKHVCAVHKKQNIEEFGYGTGYRVALDSFRELLAKLDRLRAKGVAIIILGHSTIKAFKNPTGEDYERYQLRVNEKAGNQVREWCDVVGFLRFDEYAAKDGRRTRGVSSGKRIVALRRDAAWDAKSRLALPVEVTLELEHPWAPFNSAVTDGALSQDDLRDAIETELLRLGNGAIVTPSGKETTAERIRVGCATADRATLVRTIGTLREI